MGKPAARMGDQTAHGGVIVKGQPNVLIGGKPAARLTDMHTCPMQTPGTPPIPHVGGPIVGPGAPTVLIGGMPAAVVGDSCVCTGPPDSIVAGCTTVLIGQGGGGGGGLSGAGAGPKKGEAKSAEGKEGHSLDVAFEDNGGLPVSGANYSLTGPDGKVIESGPLAGRVKKGGVKEGSYEIEIKAISKAEWSKSEAEVGDKLSLKAKTAGIESGTEATMTVYMRDINASDKSIAHIKTSVSGDKVECDWTFAVDESLLKAQDQKAQAGGYSSPSFYFTVEAGGCLARSGILHLKDYLEIELTDEDGKAIGGVPYKVTLPNGEVRTGKLDGGGKARIEKVPPGKAQVAFDLKAKK
jgi:uncharacterized Zn-binding protein involved in type VI secretion